MQVANALATFFINENLKMRETQAVGTSDFLEAELENMRKRLEAKEQDLKEYRQRYMGELPEQLDSNLKILERLKPSSPRKRRACAPPRSAWPRWRPRIGPAEHLGFGRRTGAAPTGRESEDAMTLQQLKSGFRPCVHYTDQHPDVVRMKARIEKMEAEAGLARHRLPAAADRAADAGS